MTPECSLRIRYDKPQRPFVVYNPDSGTNEEWIESNTVVSANR